jgi:hypothetical protein
MPDHSSLWDRFLHFLVNETNPWIISVLVAAITALWAFYRFRYEKKLEKFKEAYTSLFVDDKQLKLSSIATLGVFKKDPLFEKHTIDVLISKLYTETDYDVTNAISNALIQFSNRRELMYIANEILDINRNFYVQTKPYEYMARDLDSTLTRVTNTRLGAYDYVPDDSPENISKNDETYKLILRDKYLAIERTVVDDLQASIQNEYLPIHRRNRYELIWGKQLTSDTYNRIIRRAANMRIYGSAVFFEYLYKAFILWDFKIYTSKFELRLYQNDFSYSTFADIMLKKLELSRSSFQSAIIADVHIHKTEIFDTAFNKAGISSCTISNGRVHRSPFFFTMMDGVVFRNLHIEDFFLYGSRISHCRFENCTGLYATSFYNTTLDESTLSTLPETIQEQIKNGLTDLEFTEAVKNCKLYNSDKALLVPIVSAPASE